MLPRLRALNRAVEEMIAICEAEIRVNASPDIPAWLWEQNGARPPELVEMVYPARKRVAPPTGICPICGVNPLRKKQKTCSDACRQKNYRDTRSEAR
jgi:predicted nucleic acid-binding Zn ribbon protein